MSEFKLDSMTKTCRCVVNFPFKDGKPNDIFLSRIKKGLDELSSNCYQYASIIHDKDIDNDGVLKIKHLHLVFECPKRHRLSFYLNRLSEYFDIPKELISIQVSNSFDGDIQYLIHKNNVDKYQYDVKDIMSNMGRDLDIRLMTEIHKEITAEYIFDIVKNSKTKTNIILKLGLGNYHLFAKVVDDFCRDGWLAYDLNNCREVNEL